MGSFGLGFCQYSIALSIWSLDGALLVLSLIDIRKSYFSSKISRLNLRNFMILLNLTNVLSIIFTILIWLLIEDILVPPSWLSPQITHGTTPTKVAK